MTCNVIYKLFVISDTNKIYVCSLKLQCTVYAVYLMVILIQYRPVRQTKRPPICIYVPICQKLMFTKYATYTVYTRTGNTKYYVTEYLKTNQIVTQGKANFIVPANV